jgi:hypothetical protein
MVEEEGFDTCYFYIPLNQHNFFHVPFVHTYVHKHTYTYSKFSADLLQLLWISDNPNWIMKNALHSWVLMYEWKLGRQIGHLSVWTTLDSFLKPTKTSTTCDSSTNERNALSCYSFK